jgi:hypothetical protein
MTKQLTLIDTPKAWRLDERTRAVGREGVAQARAALRAGLHGRPQHPPGGPPTPAGPTARVPGRPAGHRPDTRAAA